MHITCQECHSEFELRVEKVETTRGVKSSCPFCKAPFKVHPEAEGEKREVSFEGKGPKLRTCIECGREFLGDPTAPIPICDTCQAPLPDFETSSAPGTSKPGGVLEEAGGFSETGLQIWKVLIRGKMTEHSSEASVREWIVQGLIEPTDRITLPSGEDKPAFQIPTLKEAFRIRKEKQTSSQMEQTNYLPSFRLKPFTVLGWCLVLLFLLLLGFTGYRAITFTPPEYLTNKQLRTILSEIRATNRPSQLDEEATLQRALRLLAADRQRDYDAALSLLKSSLLQHQSSGKVLGLLSEAYSFLAKSSPDPDALVSALQLANLCTELYDQEARCQIAKARAALAANNLEIAEEASRTAIELDSSNLRAVLVRAAYLVTSKNLSHSEEARRKLEQVTKVNPGLLEAYDLLGILALNEGDPVAARTAFEKRMTVAPDDPLSLYRMSLLSRKAGRFQEASEWIQSALRLDRHLTEARLVLAELEWFSNKNPSKAERHLKQLLNRYSSYASSDVLLNARSNLVALQLRRKGMAEAESSANELTATFSKNPLPALVRAEYDLMLSQYEKAAGLLRTAIDRTPDHRLYLSLARVIEAMSEKGQADQVIKAYREAIDSDPYFPISYFYALKFLTKSERWEEALDIANAGLSRHLNSNRDLLLLQPEDLLLPPDWKGFQATLKRFATIQKSATSLATLAWLTMVEAHWTQNKKLYADSTRHLRAALSITPNHEASLLLLGKSLFHQKKFLESRRVLRKALNVNPVGTSLKYWFGRASIARKEWNEAENRLKEIQKDKVWGPFATFELGESARARKNRDLALARYREAVIKAPRLARAWAALLDFGSL